MAATNHSKFMLSQIIPTGVFSRFCPGGISLRWNDRAIFSWALATALLFQVSLGQAQEEEIIDPLEDLEGSKEPQAPATEKETAERFTNELMRDAHRYATGDFYEYKPKRAFELYKKVAITGNPRAVYHVARCLILGEGVAKNRKRGQEILKELSGVLVQKKGFRFAPGFNPVTKKPYKKPADMKIPSIELKTFKSRSGEEIIDPKVLKIEARSIRMMHSTGISTFFWSELPAYVQDMVGYDETSILLETELLSAMKAKTGR